MDYTKSEQTMEDVFADALQCFNPDWFNGDQGATEFRNAVRLVTRAKLKQHATDITSLLRAQAW